MRRIGVGVLMVVCLSCGAGGAGPPHEGDTVTKRWADAQFYASRRCRDGSTLTWTDAGYWSSKDHTYHEAPDFVPEYDREPLRSCVH